METVDADWLPMPDYQIPIDNYWSQFWLVQNWFQPFILPILALTVSVIVISKVIKLAFK